MPGPNHQVKMSSRPASHMSNGGIDCVASSWISDVSASMSYALERLDVAREQRAVRLVELGATRRRRDVARARASPAHAAARCSPTRRSCRAAPPPRRLPAQDLAEDQHGALARREVLQRGDERQADRLARDRDARPGSGIGWIQVTSGGTFRLLSTGSCAGPRSIGRARRSRPLSMSRQTLVAIR